MSNARDSLAQEIYGKAFALLDKRQRREVENEIWRRERRDLENRFAPIEKALRNAGIEDLDEFAAWIKHKTEGAL